MGLQTTTGLPKAAIAELVSLFLLVEVLCCTHAIAQFRTDGLCVKGGRHKTRASRETGFSACHNYQNNSCCTSNFTTVLAGATVTHIDNFHWGRCGNLSRECEQYMIDVECFYRCSPNAANWEGEFKSSISGVPVCSDFCDGWFTACRNELSCATNWISDFNTTNGQNYCRDDEQCLTWEARYGNATNMCHQLWGASFVYTANATDCIQFRGSGLLARNTEVSRRVLPLQGSAAQSALHTPFTSALLTAVLSFTTLAITTAV